MPSNKTVSVLIVCIGLVISVWLFSDQNKSLSVEKKDDLEVVSAIQTKETSENDWKKLLTTVENSNTYVDLTNDSANDEEGTTLTDQLSRDFMSQYLLAVKGGNKINQETASVIAQKTLALPEYNEKPVVYIRQNLRVTPKKDIDTYKKYGDSLNENMESLYYGLSGDPLEIVINALNTENEAELEKLDPIIRITSGMLKYFLKMEVPEGAVNLHLELVNSVSAIVKDLEYMRDSLEDPVKIFPAIGNYTENSSRFKIALERMDLFLKSNR